MALFRVQPSRRARPESLDLVALGNIGRQRALRLGALIGVLVLGCTAGPHPTGGGEYAYPGEFVSTEAIAGNFLMRQQIRYRSAEQQGSFEAVVQQDCGELTVVGLTPFGTRAFSIRQRGLDVDVETHSPGPWPFPARNVLLDIHRIYFIPLAADPPRDGERELLRDPEVLGERWASGRLMERSFRRLSGNPPGRIVVSYLGGATPREPAREILFENGWFGYRLEITTLARVELACPREP